MSIRIMIHESGKNAVHILVLHIFPFRSQIKQLIYCNTRLLKENSKLFDKSRPFLYTSQTKSMCVTYYHFC
jgi:hypothetical protein